MPDVLTPKQRSYCMSRIRGKDTSIELTIRSMLHKKGRRFRKHVTGLPGRPDVVFPSKKVAVFIDGDFWHGHRFAGWKNKLSPKWRDKIDENIRRDRRNFRRLRTKGWTVVRLWENEIEKNPETALAKIESTLEGASK